MLASAGAFTAAGATAETRVEPRIGVGGVYVSNVTLAPSGQEDDDWVAELKPGISIVHESSLFKLDLDYDLQALFYADNGDYDDQFSNFLGSGVALWGMWVTTNMTGYFAGNSIPASWSLDFAVPLCFIALVAPLPSAEALSKVKWRALQEIAGLPLAPAPWAPEALTESLVVVLLGTS